MAPLDLKPLSKETIQKMGFTSHDLWVVKIGQETYGPFETQSLRHYASENEEAFLEAIASRIDQNDWHPFFSHALFQRRSNKVEKVLPTHEDGPFWVLIQGQKSAPISKAELDKKIESRAVVLTDLVSCDDGHSWQKIYQIPCYDRRNRTNAALPGSSPNEASFQRAKLELTEKIEIQEVAESAQGGLASLAYLGKQQKDHAVNLNIEEITLKMVNETEVARSLKWAIPSVFAGFIVLAVTTYYLFSPKTDEGLQALSEEPISMPAKLRAGEVSTTAPAQQSAHSPITTQEMPIRRVPASVAPLQPERRELTQPSLVHDSQYPTQMETHVNEPEPNADGLEAEPMMDPLAETEPAPEQPREEHSLVNDTPTEEESLDNQMNGAARSPAEADLPADRPEVQEASDF